MLKDQKDLLLEFNAAGVEYLVIGGHAVNAYGVPRMTKDLDVLIRSDERNSVAVYRALTAFGAPLEGTTAADFRDQESIFQIGVEPGRVDLIPQGPGIAFESAWEHRVAGVVDGTHEIFFISRDDLILNKLESGRPQDLADVDHLRRAASTQPLK